MAGTKSRELYDQARGILDSTRASFLQAPWANADGGFAKAPSLESDSWSTAEAVALAHRLGIGDEPRIDEAVTFLITAQHHDGGWGTRPGVSDTTGTALSLAALHGRRHEPQVIEAVERGLEWLALNQNPDGGWPLIPASDKTKTSTVFTTVHAYQAVLMWFLSNVGDAATTNEMLTLSSDMLNSVRQDDAWGLTKGSDPTVRHTAYVVLAGTDAVSSGSSFDSMVRVRKGARGASGFVRRQHEDGTWGEGSDGDVESTASAVRALVALGQSATSRSLRAGVSALLRGHREAKSPGGRRYSGWGVSSNGDPALWTTCYGTLALADFVDGFEGERRARKMIRVRPWRKALLAFALLILACTLVGIIALGPSGGFTALTVLASVASLIGAFPVLVQWFRRVGARLR